MKKLTLIVSLVVASVLLAAGVAFAANIRCEAGADFCDGTSENDRIVGSGGQDFIRAMQGNDTVSGGGSIDQIYGGAGADTLSGGEGDDTLVAPGVSGRFIDDNQKLIDNSNDVLRGGPGRESIRGGGGQGGVDRIFSGEGNDVIGVDQRFDRAQGIKTRVTKEIVDCGPGTDQIFYDDKIDEISRNCEILNPVGPDGEPAGNGKRSNYSERPELPF